MAAAVDSRVHGGSPHRLRDVDGYRVDSPPPGSRIGFVDGVRLNPETGAPEALVVRVGMLGSRRLLIPLAAVAAVQPSRRVVVLSESWMLAVFC